jgi:hypothetical protein
VATSVVEIVNLALRRVGYKIEVGSIYEGTVAARAALQSYGQTRDALLRSRDWPFARQAAALTLLKTAPVGGYGITGWTSAYPPPPWIYEYGYPAACVEVRALLGTPAIIPEFMPRPTLFTVATDPALGTGTKVILTNVANAQAVFTGQIIDMTQWEPMFTEAMVEALARRLAESLGAPADAVKEQFQVEQATAAAAATRRG